MPNDCCPLQPRPKATRRCARWRPTSSLRTAQSLDRPRQDARASQINGCAYCLDVHSKDARKHGESEQRLYLLNAWRESPVYSRAERAALAWTEALTEIAERRAPDADYEELRRHFTEKEIVDLTMLVGMINLWNRLAIGMGYVHDAS